MRAPPEDPVSASSTVARKAKQTGTEGTRQKTTLQAALPEAGRSRVVVAKLIPEIDCGRFPIKRVLGEEVRVQADLFADGHDALNAVLKYRHESEPSWSEVRMELETNDRWTARFTVARLGIYLYTVEAWVDPFRTWRNGLQKKFTDGQDVAIDLQTGANLLRIAQERAEGSDFEKLQLVIEHFESGAAASQEEKAAEAMTPDLLELMDRNSTRDHASTYGRNLSVVVDPPLAAFGFWYEMFPRSCGGAPAMHGTFADCATWLPRLARLGVDVLYLPPIHPIGRAFRKGRNGALKAEPEDPGSPWAIGGVEGGHKAIHPELGTFEDFAALVRQAETQKIKIALDIAFQCSPDHPYVKEHPEWFRHRPDGSIQYAENPPKKYQDIYPLNFESDDWRSLWQELKSIFDFWVARGVKVFRVDNPHTKPFAFWEWCLGELKAAHPDLIFLSEAFTRPKVMYQLAKAGFTQSYNYFPWRNTKAELTEFMTELTKTEVREYFRPNLWPNTPDILTAYLQHSGKAGFMVRFLLAATLGGSYGIYGPPFERCESSPREPGSEEYLNSEKYELRHWDPSGESALGELIARVNQIRRENPALHGNESLQFHAVDNEQLIAYSKHTPDDIILTVVNLDPYHTHTGWVTVNLDAWGFLPTDTYQCHELLTEARYLWKGPRNYVELNPQYAPAHIFRVRKYVRTEQDFDYFA